MDPPSRVRKSTLLAVFAVFLAGMYLSGVVRNWQGGNAAVRQLEALSAAGATGERRGALLADLAFRDADGVQRTLAQYSGRMVLLNVWATWCAPCREELPSLDRLQRDFGDDRFQVLAVSIDEAGAPAVQRFYRSLDLTSLALHVSSLEALAAARVSAIPVTLLIDGTGAEVWRIAGAVPWDDPAVVRLLRGEIDRRLSP